MIVPNAIDPEFGAFLAENTRAWTARRPPGPARGRRCVLVELLHSHASLLLSNLLIARYLAGMLDAEVVAVVKRQFLQYPLPVDGVTALARSYGVAEVIDLDAAAMLAETPATEAALVRHVDLLRPLEGEALRRAILALGIDGVWLGDLIYDTHVRCRCLPTIERFDDDLARTVVQAHRWHAGCQRIFDDYDVAATVLSHTVYLDYALVLRVAAHRNVPTYAKRGDMSPFQLWSYLSVHDSWMYYQGQIELDDIETARAMMGERFTEEAKTFFPPKKALAGSLAHLQIGYINRDQAQTDALARLGLRPGRKTAAIMAHMFYDGPHSYAHFVFDDYSVWLHETLAFAAEHPEINWLVRQHPYECLIGETAMFDAIARPFLDRCEHIKLVPNEVSTGVLLDVVDALVTVGGTAAMEFGAVGVPTIAAGESFYSRLGVARTACSREEYFALLAGIPQLGRLDPATVRRAKEAAYLMFRCQVIGSTFLPIVRDLAVEPVTAENYAAFWQSAAERVRTRRVDEDPLYWSLRDMLVNERRRALDLEHVFGIGA